MLIFLGTFLTIDATTTGAITSTMGDLIGDLLPLIAIILGVGLAIWIINAFFHRGER